MKENKKSNCAFIDGQNLYLGTRELGWELDYKKFRIYLKEKYDVEKAFIFIGYIDTNQDLYSDLQENGYILKFKPVLYARNGKKPKADVDADLVLNVMKYYNEYNQAVFVTSDGDFDTTVKHLRKKDKLRIVLSPNREKCSALLQKAAQDKINYLDNLKNKLRKIG